ncbi:hypothetical protein MUO71_02920 [Candidatus Bathyarchaeota archaeon]|nr:hypothetical protein [Candidatus Bathyarchaeota archaeon]
MTLQVISEYSKPLPGDLIISFTENKESEQGNSGFLDSNLPAEHGYTIVAVTAITTVAVALTVYRRRLRKKGEFCRING